MKNLKHGYPFTQWLPTKTPTYPSSLIYVDNNIVLQKVSHMKIITSTATTLEVSVTETSIIAASNTAASKGYSPSALAITPQVIPPT